jgi:hypothetical protein
MVKAKAFQVTQLQEAKTKALVPLILRRPQKPLGDPGVLSIEFGPIAISALNQAKCFARQTDAQTSFLNRPSGYLASARWP